MNCFPPRALLCLAAAVWTISCKSSPKASNIRHYDWAKLDAELPSGSTATPPHQLSRFEYPFDASGNYISSWAARGDSSGARGTYAASNPTPRPSRPTPSAPRPKPAPQPAPSARYHTVAAGDTLYSLSRRYGTSVTAIKSANGLSSDLIVNGRRLKIP